MPPAVIEVDDHLLVFNADQVRMAVVINIAYPQGVGVLDGHAWLLGDIGKLSPAVVEEDTADERRAAVEIAARASVREQVDVPVIVDVNRYEATLDKAAGDGAMFSLEGAVALAIEDLDSIAAAIAQEIDHAVAIDVDQG